VLIEAGLAEISKAYILYRNQRGKDRERKQMFMDINEVMEGYLTQSDWRTKENSNTDYSFSGLMLHTAGSVIANYVLSEMYPHDVAEAHKKGYFHLHDLSCGVVGYCAGWSLKNLILTGFNGVPNKVDALPAKHLDVLVNQMVNFIGCLQMEFAGAQAFSSIDTLLAPFVRRDKLTFKQVKQAMQILVYSLNVPSRWGSQMPFSNLTFDWKVPEDMKDLPAIVGGEEMGFTYGDCQAEMDMINKAFLEVMMSGDASGRIFTFPIPTYNLTGDFDWDSDNANLLFEATARYGMPYFQNYIGSNLDPRSVRAMCCRLNMDLNQLRNKGNGIFGAGEQTGSVGVVTINVNRLAYESSGKDEFFRKLDQYLTLAKTSLEIKREVIERNLAQGLMPYTKRYLGTFRNHFSTIGLCGMNEACVNLLGKPIAEPEAKAFAMETLNYMRTKLVEFQNETGNLYNLEATPAESAGYRMARADKKAHPDIYTAGTDAPYLTNSTWLPVNATEDVIEAITHQNELQPLYTGGTVFHVFMGEKLSSGEACKQLVKKIAFNTRLPYFSVTPTFSICPEHGYVAGEHFSCPCPVKETA
jgi:ribonucleoside-triphosphate reductase